VHGALAHADRSRSAQPRCRQHLDNNEQTLADSEARALYDAVAGLSEGAVNPFTDTSFPADQVGWC
jgi:hypothetical protein